MKVYSLYHNDEFVASFRTREDAIFYGKQFYEDAWSCDIIQEYLTKFKVTETYNVEHGKPPSFKDRMSSPPLTQKTPWTCTDSPDQKFTFDYTQPILTNYYEGPKAEVSQGHRRKDMDML